MTSEIEARLAALEQRQRAHGEVLAALEGVTTNVHNLSEQVADLMLDSGLGKSEKVDPWSNPRWHDLAEKQDGEEMAAELHRLKGFLKHLAEPLLGWRNLRFCTLQHMPAVLAIDAACELYRVLWFPEDRTTKLVGQQADALTRAFPLLLHQINREVDGCLEHTRQPTGGDHRG